MPRTVMVLRPRPAVAGLLPVAVLALGISAAARVPVTVLAVELSAAARMAVAVAETLLVLRMARLAMPALAMPALAMPALAMIAGTAGTARAVMPRSRRSVRVRTLGRAAAAAKRTAV
ncbi:MAG: hypothetical protein AB7S57_04270 [Acetobacteraceae bacterium]